MVKISEERLTQIIDERSSATSEEILTLAKSYRKRKYGNGGWIEWRGGSCPVPSGTLIDVRYRGEYPDLFNVFALTSYRVEDPYWHHDQCSWDIVAYRKRKYGKAAESPWIEWTGGECPVPAGTLIDVQYREPQLAVFNVPALDIRSCTVSDYWRNDDSPCDIVAYRYA